MHNLLVLMTIFSFGPAATLASTESETPTTPKEITETQSGIDPTTEELIRNGIEGHFSLAAPKHWEIHEGQGYIELEGTKDDKGLSIRAYAIGLRSVGGKYRNLEHVVDDTIFQMRDEFKGSVSE